MVEIGSRFCASASLLSFSELVFFILTQIRIIQEIIIVQVELFKFSNNKTKKI